MIFYGVPASNVSDTLVSLISLLPYFLVSQADVSILSMVPISLSFPLLLCSLLGEAEMAEMKLFHFPIPIFNKTIYQPYITLECVDKLKDVKSYVIGTSMLSSSFLRMNVTCDLIDRQSCIWLRGQRRRLR